MQGFPATATVTSPAPSLRAALRPGRRLLSYPGTGNDEDPAESAFVGVSGAGGGSHSLTSSGVIRYLEGPSFSTRTAGMEISTICSRPA